MSEMPLISEVNVQRFSDFADVDLQKGKSALKYNHIVYMYGNAIRDVHQFCEQNCFEYQTTVF